jgi:hypothetical protein
MCHHLWPILHSGLKKHGKERVDVIGRLHYVETTYSGWIGGEWNVIGIWCPEPVELVI